jgi:hypothetical protein
MGPIRPVRRENHIRHRTVIRLPNHPYIEPARVRAHQQEGKAGSDSDHGSLKANRNVPPAHPAILASNAFVNSYPTSWPTFFNRFSNPMFPLATTYKYAAFSGIFQKRSESRSLNRVVSSESIFACQAPPER